MDPCSAKNTPAPESLRLTGLQTNAKNEPVWKNSGRFLKPVYMWRCKRGLETEAEEWTRLFANPETRIGFFKKAWVLFLRPAASRPCHAYPSHADVPGRGISAI